jgi:hypothetical protein
VKVLGVLESLRVGDNSDVLLDDGLAGAQKAGTINSRNDGNALVWRGHGLC